MVDGIFVLARVRDVPPPGGNQSLLGMIQMELSKVRRCVRNTELRGALLPGLRGPALD